MKFFNKTVSLVHVVFMITLGAHGDQVSSCPNSHGASPSFPLQEKTCSCDRPTEPFDDLCCGYNCFWITLQFSSSTKRCLQEICLQNTVVIAFVPFNDLSNAFSNVKQNLLQTVMKTWMIITISTDSCRAPVFPNCTSLWDKSIFVSKSGDKQILTLLFRLC